MSRQLFIDKTKKVEILTLDELKRTINAEDVGGLSRTRPVHHSRSETSKEGFIDDIMDILITAGYKPEIEHIYVANSPGTKLIKRIEEQFGEEKVLEAWLLDRITGKIILKELSNEEMTACICFSYHDKGLEIAFGNNVWDCSNMCIFGSNVIRTYGPNKISEYKDFLDVFREWSTNLEAMNKADQEIITAMKESFVTGDDMLWFIGKLLACAVASNSGLKVIAPLNVTDVSSVTRGLLDMKVTIFAPENTITLWQFYNCLTYVCKADSSDIISLLTDVMEIGNMVRKEFLPIKD
jgi:hypothetical protein